MSDLEIMGPCSERISNEQCPQQSVCSTYPAAAFQVSGWKAPARHNPDSHDLQLLTLAWAPTFSKRKRCQQHSSNIVRNSSQKFEIVRWVHFRPVSSISSCLELCLKLCWTEKRSPFWLLWPRHYQVKSKFKNAPLRLPADCSSSAKNIFLTLLLIYYGFFSKTTRSAKLKF